MKSVLFTPVSPSCSILRHGVDLHFPFFFDLHFLYGNQLLNPDLGLPQSLSTVVTNALLCPALTRAEAGSGPLFSRKGLEIAVQL